jgi:hypothetical protein
MEFNVNRGSQPAAARPAQAAAAGVTGSGKPHKMGGFGNPKWIRVIWITLLFAVTFLIAAIALLLYFGGPKESNLIDNKKEQAVFLTNGQVYFGKVGEVNKSYLTLSNIYYLNVNQQVQPNQKDANGNSNSANNSISLVKLGCELHGPVDRMVINRDQITFWENLKDDGQVSKAIAQWVQQNPNGQKCATANTGTSNTTTTTKP